MEQEHEGIVRYNRAKHVIMMEHKFFAVGLMELDHIPDFNVKTATVNGKEIRYNPDFLAALTDKRARTLIAHEILHVYGLDHVRIMDNDPGTWNEAADHVQNLMLMGSGFDPIPGWLCDARFADMARERVYRELWQEKQEDQQDEEQQDGADNGDNGGEGGAGGESTPNDQDSQQDGGDSGNGENGEASDGDSQPGEGDGNSQDGDSTGSDGNDGTPSGQSGNAGQSADFGGCGEVLPMTDDSGQPLTGAELQEEATKWTQIVARAARVAKQCGELPGSLEIFADQMTTARMPWKHALRRFIDNHAKNRSNWMKPNRRHIADGLILPTTEGKKLKPLAIALDTSGSLVGEMNELLNEIGEALKQYPIQKVVVLHVDRQLRHVQEFKRGDLLQIDKAYGGGGTSFHPPFEWLDEQQEQFAGLVYLTDLEGSAPEWHAMKTLWICTQPPHRVEHRIPKFGEVVYFD